MGVKCKIITKEFSYRLEAEINEWLEKNNIQPENIIDIKYQAHTGTVHNYSALILYKE